ncbi:hypothetical protein [Paenibacillus hamazuiensis]|uniref:hypothetical protein n=1 Tax=Paenibacillus hamazuiensis TaxID=2936508 RepID=UPI00200D886E|nr:hypothetical protein [Paenibacillus hamazuiensis]
MKHIIPKVIAVVVFLSMSTVVVNAADPITGTLDDPLVTRSYVEQKVKQLIVEELGKANDPSKAKEPSSAANNNAGLTVINLTPGQTLYADAGTEIIIRTGKVTAVSSDENGIPDVTSGKDIQAGSAVELNHLLIFPKEGRGIKSDPKLKQDTYVMVRGSFTITNPDGTKAAPTP